MTRIMGKRTYILDLVSGGKRKITVPASWKLTFGNVLPYNKIEKLGGPYLPPGDGWESRIVLRIYEGTHIRAVMNDVVSFADETIEISELAAKPVQKTNIRTTSKGQQDVDIVTAPVPTWEKVRHVSG